MFTTEREQAQRFNAILRQTVSENQILENLQNMGLDSKQIQALSSAIEIASRNNMANVIEHYVSKDYDISQLSTMNNLLIAYLDQNDTSRFLDNSRQLDMLLSTKQKFDLQIAQREELASLRKYIILKMMRYPKTRFHSILVTRIVSGLQKAICFMILYRKIPICHSLLQMR